MERIDLPCLATPYPIPMFRRYFVDDLRLLHDHMTVELLYLQSRQAIMKVRGRMQP